MCGLAGFYTPDESPESCIAQLHAMLVALEQRGPDASGDWFDAQCGVYLGHRRLSVLELSESGSQPMVSADGRWVISFNGEIYNHLELRRHLGAAVVWRGRSDTETLVEGFAHWGVRSTLEQAAGMFAFAAWDRHSGELWLARDRMGEKPLYYGWQGGHFFFASQLNALRRHPAFRESIDWDAAADFLRYGYVPGPASIFAGIQKLQPGHCLKLSREDLRAKQLPTPVAYWSINQQAIAGMQQPFKGSVHEASQELERLLARAVSEQSIADVPVGAFLSGGVDSSLITALMAQHNRSDVVTFSIGVPALGMDESAYAQAVAQHLGTRHVAHTISPDEARQIVTRVPEVWDEPFADKSQIPTYLVSELARRQVTVALSGDGGDELFLGYRHQAQLARLWGRRWLRNLPWSMALGALTPLNRNTGVADVQRRGRSYIEALRQPDFGHLCATFFDRTRRQGVLLHRQGSLNPVLPPLGNAVADAGLYDLARYLPDDVLVKVDRASMAHSLEVRAPLLDHRVVEFAQTLPVSYRFDPERSKRVLREVLYRYVPRELIDRPKQGFAIPLGKWMRDELRDWVRAHIEAIPEDSPVLDRAGVERVWSVHESGQRDMSEILWNIVTLQAFLAGVRSGQASVARQDADQVDAR